MEYVKTFVTFALTLLFIIALCNANLARVQGQTHGHIFINEDGSVSPTSAPIIQKGNFYTLTNDHEGTIVITKSDITFDGNGYTINQQASFPTNADAFGIELNHVHNVTVTNITIINTGNGVYAIQDPTAGIEIIYGDSNIIVGNNLLNNYNGISLLESNHNTIIQNNITNSNQPGTNGSAIGLWGSSDNQIYQNNFIDNESPLINKWDNGKEGNFWDDYIGIDANGDGIGDTTYKVDSKNVDHYPLMEPFNSTLYWLETTAPSITVVSPSEETTFNQSSVILSFIVDKEVSWTGYCLDGQQNVTVSGNMTLTGLNDSLHYVTVYANDSFGNMGASSIVNFTVALPILKTEINSSTQIVAISISAVAVIAIGLIIYRRHRKTVDPKIKKIKRVWRL
jgi:parallel beta-helix repeat protein